MKWLKDLMIEKQLAKKTAKNLPREIIVPKELKSVGILANSQEEFHTCKEVLRAHFQYKVKIIGYYYFEGENKELLSNEAVNDKNFTVFGKATDYFSDFKTEKFDCIIIPSKNLNPYLLSLLSESQFGFRLGFYSPNHNPYFDLMLERQEDLYLSDQINDLLKYLNKIN